MSVVLDASAMVALLYREPGADVVAAALDSATISTVNLCEVASRFTRDGIAATQILDRLSDTSMTVIPFEPMHAERAAAIVPHTKGKGLSLGDRACLALAWSLGVPALTADRAWTELPEAVGVEVRLIR